MKKLLKISIILIFLVFSCSDSEKKENIDKESKTNYSYSIVDTSQANCYNSSTGIVILCKNTGTDADYNNKQASYTLSEDKLTVKDDITGLTWTQSSDINNDNKVNYDDKIFQSEAITYCEELDLGGYTDWRLPSVKEAFSLILFTGEDPSSYTGTDTSQLVLFIDDIFDRAFGDLDSPKDRLIDAQYASSSIYTATTMNNNPTMFGVNYVDGRIKGYPLNNKEYYVRCVRGNTNYAKNNFIDNKNETVSDRSTGLMWHKDDMDSSDWENAISLCESSELAGYTDWKLPNIKELHSIVDYSKSPDSTNSPSIDDIFNSTSIINENGEKDWGYYWASTTHLDYNAKGSNATYIAFGRALGYMNNNILDVHGAGSQRSNDKLDVTTEPGAKSALGANGKTFYYKGPQGDILRINNKVRCVRTDDTETEVTEIKQVMASYPAVGAINSNSAQIIVNLKKEASIKIEYADNKNFENLIETDSFIVLSENDFTTKINLSNLEENKVYWYRVIVNEEIQTSSYIQKFKTFPANTNSECKFAVFADTANTDRPAIAYKTAKNDDILFSLQIGDLNHSDPKSLTEMRNMHKTIKNETGGFVEHITSKMGLVHIWDDHDYGGNDEDRFFEGKADALKAFKEHWPTYQLENEAGLWHKFRCGSAEFFVLDLRSQRDKNTDEDNTDKSMLDGGNIENNQKTWLKNALLNSDSKWKIIISSVTANKYAREDISNDLWHSFSTEASEIADFIEENNIKNIFVLSADIHTGGGIDNGINSLFRIPELTVPHTNLIEANSNNLGTWSEGVTSGENGKGYALITINQNKAELQVKSYDGNLRHDFTLE